MGRPKISFERSKPEPAAAKYTPETLRFHLVNGKTVRAVFTEKRCPDILPDASEGQYQTKSGKGLDIRVIYKAEVNQTGNNPRFVVTSIKSASARCINEQFYCRQDENLIKHLKNDLSCDRTSDMGFRANALRMYYACAAYVLDYEMKTTTLEGTDWQRAQPSTVIAKLFRIAIKGVEYRDRGSCICPAVTQ